MPEDLREPRPRGLLRFFLRMPIWVYRLRLGFLLGYRFLMLTHTGRKSGQARQAVVEVVRYDRASGLCVIASGWGEKSDWVLNIRKTPRVTVTIGNLRFSAEATRLPAEGAARELADYARRYPVAFSRLATWKLGKVPEDKAEACRAMARWIPLFALEPVRD